jgi:hypothetical protein
MLEFSARDTDVRDCMRQNLRALYPDKSPKTNLATSPGMTGTRRRRIFYSKTACAVRIHGDPA